ncbi:hypothetical protein ACTFIR_006406 [Dictyostelium discoideum]
MVNQLSSKESEIFLISNRFDEKEIKIFENIFNSIDLESKGYICKEDFDQYKSNKTGLNSFNIEFEKFLIFNNLTITFYQFLSLLSLTGISLNITTPPIENESKSVSSSYSRLSFIPTSVAQQQISQLFNNNNNSNSPQFSSSNSTPTVQFNNSPPSSPSILTSTHLLNPHSSSSSNLVPITTTIAESTLIETIGKGSLNNIGLNNNNNNSNNNQNNNNNNQNNNTDSDNENKRTSRMGLGGHRGKS